VLHGTGAPAGTAPTGTRYIDDAATCGAVEWIYDGTAWKVTYGDTGWRNVAAAIQSNWTVDSFVMRRVGNTCFVDIINITRTASGTAVYTPPAGFKNAKNFKVLVGTGDATPVVHAFSVGAVFAFTQSVPAGVTAHLSYLTNDAWPTTLPGTPA
jgi:hypothetical protein